MKVVVAIDDQDSADIALEYLFKQNYSSDTQVHLVHVLVPGFADVAVEGIPDPEELEKRREIAILDTAAKTIREKSGFACTTDVIYGDIAEVIADSCKKYEADQAIVPGHARHGFARLWFGSISGEIVDAAPCAVVVLKIPQGKS